MPTWRKELNQYTETQFKESEFFKAYDSLLNNEIIASLANNDDYKITFYLHRNLQKFSHLFNAEYASVISEGVKNVNTLLKENELLITDYSSVGFDFALMHKKVIYYRPSSLISEEMTEENQSLLPGDIIKKETKLFEEIQCLTMKNAYKEDMEALYKYEDIHACERISEEMIKRFNI
ncbi:CDP-glycerol glycerophosphotransferase family protein [Staphylococcus equorum]